jgi:hypothetical protein
VGGGGGFSKGFWWEDLKNNRRLERPRRSWRDNVKMNFKDIEWEKAEWIYFDLDKDMASSFERGK